MIKLNDFQPPVALSSRQAPAAEKATTEPTVSELVRSLPGWYLADRRRTLGVKYRFREGLEALEFLAKVTRLAAELGATPHLVLTPGGQLHLRLRSRQLGGVGAEEIRFARAVSNLYPAEPTLRSRFSETNAVA
jgi:pterin-4a-carbinolamine dehydratase